MFSSFHAFRFKSVYFEQYEAIQYIGSSRLFLQHITNKSHFKDVDSGEREKGAGIQPASILSTLNQRITFP